MTATLLAAATAAATAQTTELQLGTTLALSSAHRSSATCLHYPCAPLHTLLSTLSASLLSSELRSATRPAADLGQPILGPAASWSSSRRRGNCSVAWLHLGSTWLHNAQRTKGQKDTQYIPASITRSSKYMAAPEDHL